MLTNCSSDGALGSVGEGLKSNKQLKRSVSWVVAHNHVGDWIASENLGV